jgi:hypothetical protein
VVRTAPDPFTECLTGERKGVLSPRCTGVDVGLLPTCFLPAVPWLLQRRVGGGRRRRIEHRLLLLQLLRVVIRRR